MSAQLHVALGVLGGVTGGPASYGVRLARALLALPDAPRLTVLTDRPDRFAALPAGEVIGLPCRGGVDRLRWQHLALPRALRRIAPDVYHDTKNALPHGLRVPAVVTVHDLAYHVQPETFGLASRLFLRRATADAVRRARLVLVPSQATARDVQACHPAAAARLRVVHHGVDPAPEVPAAAVAALRARFGLPARYVLHVGTIQARKNVDLLIRAVRPLRAAGLDVRVVLAGRRGWRAERTFAELRADDTARWLGEVEAADLPALRAGAFAFASPSGYEGFGLAVADALAAGVPTLVSDLGSLPEVCGDAAPCLPLDDLGAWTAALRRLIDDPAWHAELAARGRRRAAEFSWERAAAATRDAYCVAAG